MLAVAILLVKLGYGFLFAFHSNYDLMFGPVPGKRRQGEQRKQWFDDVTEWIGNQPATDWQKAEICLDTSFVESPKYASAYAAHKMAICAAILEIFSGK